ncbi:MAG TPA: SDR family oxidoreductase [Flavobacteriales bacterium]|nr:SDR family oxidoreductase [Flavobacteriales bacterium]
MKTVIITGAGKGIGFATTNHILDNFPSYKVIAISRNTHQLGLINNSNLQVIQGDLTSEMDNIISAIGNQKIDGLLNNAGYIVKNDIDKLTYADFLDLYKTNVFVPFDLSRKLINNFNSNAHILNIGSMGGFENTSKFPGMILYSSSKAALHCLSQCLAVELIENKIKVNCLSIGAVETEMVKVAFPGFQPPINAQTMAEAVAWYLLYAHKFMNGQIIPLALSSV